MPSRRLWLFLLTLSGSGLMMGALVGLLRGKAVSIWILSMGLGFLTLLGVSRPIAAVIPPSMPHADKGIELYMSLVWLGFLVVGVAVAWNVAKTSNPAALQALGLLGSVLALSTSFLVLIILVVALRQDE